MKKIFTLIAVAAMALSANAQVIQFDEAAAAGSVKSEYSSGDFKISFTDPENKMIIDENSQYFGTETAYRKYGTCRLNTKGKSTSTKNFITVTAPEDGTLFIAVRSGSSSETRTISIKQGEGDAVTFDMKDADAKTVTIEEKDTKVFPYIQTNVKAGSDIVVSYPTGAMYFYAFLFSKDGKLPTGIQTVKAVKNADAAVYNLAGQKVDNNFKGVVIKNGQKMIQK